MVMNRQKHFEVDPFSCFRKGHVVRKAVKKVRNPNQRGGGVFMNMAENAMPRKKKKETSMVERGEKSQMASNEQQLGRPCDLEHGRQGDREVPAREVV